MNDTDFAALCARLRELHEKAAPCPWERGVNGRVKDACNHHIIREDSFVRHADETDADIEITVKSRNALPALLDRIEADAKRIAELEADTNEVLERHNYHRTEYVKRIAELEAALKPFAKGCYGGMVPDGAALRVIRVGRKEASDFTAGDVRTAARALGGE